MKNDDQYQFGRLLTLLERNQKRIEDLEKIIKKQSEEKISNKEKIDLLKEKIRFLERKLKEMGMSQPYNDFDDLEGHQDNLFNLSDAMMKRDNLLVVGEAVVEQKDIIITESALSPSGEEWLEEITSDLKGRSLREIQSFESFNEVTQKAMWSFENKMTPSSHRYLFNFKGHQIPSIVRFIPISKEGKYKGYYFNKLYPNKKVE